MLPINCLHKIPSAVSKYQLHLKWRFCLGPNRNFRHGFFLFVEHFFEISNRIYLNLSWSLTNHLGLDCICDLMRDFLSIDNWNKEIPIRLHKSVETLCLCEYLISRSMFHSRWPESQEFCSAFNSRLVESEYRLFKMLYLSYGRFHTQSVFGVEVDSCFAISITEKTANLMLALWIHVKYRFGSVGDKLQAGHFTTGRSIAKLYGVMLEKKGMMLEKKGMKTESEDYLRSWLSSLQAPGERKLEQFLAGGGKPHEVFPPFDHIMAAHSQTSSMSENQVGYTNSRGLQCMELAIPIRSVNSAISRKLQFPQFLSRLTKKHSE